MEFKKNNEKTSDLYYDLIEGNINLNDILKDDIDIKECENAINVIRILIDEIIEKEVIKIL